MVKIISQTSSDAVSDTVQPVRKVKEQKGTMASVFENIAYVLVSIPIFIVALEVLGIRSISEPIIELLNSILATIPNILVAVILLAIGIMIANFVGDLVKNLLRESGINKLARDMRQSSMNIDLAKVIGQLVAGLITLFFVVEALNALNLEILNTIGGAIIAYIPNILFALIILGVGLIGGQWLGRLITESSGSRWAGRIVQYASFVFFYS